MAIKFVALFFLALIACSHAKEFYFNRIIGGSVAPDGFAPFAVSLRSGIIIKSHFCGGSLISPDFVATAAHCVDAVWNGNSLVISLEVLSGTNRLSEGGIRTQVSSNWTHPLWDPNTIKNDIGILKLATTLAIDNLNRPIALNGASIGDTQDLTAVGWGLTRYPGITTSNELKYLNTFAMGHQQCVALRDEIAATYPGEYPLISLGEICTFHSPGQGTCQGDSGSALYNEGGLVGIVSWGLPCARGAPDVFTRVSAYKDWVDEIIQ